MYSAAKVGSMLASSSLTLDIVGIGIGWDASLVARFALSFCLIRELSLIFW